MTADDILAALEAITGAGGVKTGGALRAIHPGSDEHISMPI